MYFLYTLDIVDLENPDDIGNRMAHAWCNYDLSAIEGVLIRKLTIMVIPITNSEQPQYTQNMQIPQCLHLRIKDTQCYVICIARAIPNSGTLQCMSSMV
ncbi:hypothetical protein TNCV_485641 [Trichonephila clavipes]|nr:hypothetical protein TNCV_485641 [Trichonephila clavipes]